VSRPYIHNCHLRVLRHLRPRGKLLLDAGSGPIQYPEYLEYSRGYQRRVCVDISIVALKEARKRIGDASKQSKEHGLFVVADIANLPFKEDCFEGIVSLHTIHHLPLEEHLRAYQELKRVLASGSRAVVVNGWDSAPLAALADGLVRLVNTLRDRGRTRPSPAPARKEASGTYVHKHNAPWLQKEVGAHIPMQIFTWRSVNVHFLRTFIHARLGGAFLLRFLYWLEECFPHFLGKNGQYPLIVIEKSEKTEQPT
jgi:SAM-dependent methyltransferase